MCVGIVARPWVSLPSRRQTAPLEAVRTPSTAGISVPVKDCVLLRRERLAFTFHRPPLTPPHSHTTPLAIAATPPFPLLPPEFLDGPTESSDSVAQASRVGRWTH